MLDSYFGQQQYVIYCSQLRAKPSADCNISHIAVGLSNYLIQKSRCRVIINVTSPELLRSQDLDQFSPLRRSEDDQ